MAAIASKHVGSFIIRKSRSSSAAYAVAALQQTKAGRCIWHGLIDTSSAGLPRSCPHLPHMPIDFVLLGLLNFRDQPTVQFATLEDLVVYYSQHPYAKDADGEPCFLVP